jgi:hypothetical protein
MTFQILCTCENGISFGHHNFESFSFKSMCLLAIVTMKFII